jgi:hypothetical protein
MRPGINRTGTITRRIASTLGLLASTLLLSVLLAHSTLARTPSYPSPATTYQATASPTMCNPTWNVVPSQNVGPNDNTLSAIAAIAPDDVWAVGYYSDTGRYKTLTQHWDGSVWSVVPSPNPGTYNNILRGGAASASSDVWAVGDYNFTPAHPTRHLLTMRWDGAQWNVVSNPDPGGNYDNALNSVKAFAANSAVAVGFYRRYAFLDLRMHWSGAWSESSTPTVYLGNLASVYGRAANDVWAVGTSPNSSGYAQPLTEHFDGNTWSVVSSPALPDNSYLYGVSVASTNDVWAVGATYTNQNPHSVLEHWDGTAWSLVPAPDVGRLSGVKAIAANDVWAIGNGTFLHWDGATWTPVPDPAGGRLAGIDALSADNIWAVGTQNVGGVDRTLIEHYSGACATSTPLPATPTPAATVTVPPSSTTPVTPQPTTTTPPTPCPFSFSDVPPGSTFYPYVHCLACRGIVQGYADGTYRPANPVTRGQASKVIARAANWLDEIPPGRQTFNDVPPGSTFWLYIERLHLHEVITGYPCGGPGEPCPGAYFRPVNTLTRGQIAQVVSISAGYEDPIPPQQQTFSDVSPGTTFWLHIERAAIHAVVNGYEDGTYRPQNTVTRGQIAKLASNAFYPACYTP